MVVSVRIILSQLILIMAVVGLLATSWIGYKRRFGMGYLVAPSLVLLHVAVFYGYVVFFSGYVNTPINATWSAVLRIHELSTLLTILFLIISERKK